MAVNMSISIQATTAQELASGIRELADILRYPSALVAAKSSVPVGGGTITIDAPTLTVEDKPVGETPTAQAESATSLAPAPAPKATASEVPEQYEAPSASIEAVRKALVPLIEAGKQAQVQELFRRFGGEKLSDIPEEKLGELLAAAEELTT